MVGGTCERNVSRLQGIAIQNMVGRDKKVEP